MPDLRLLLTVPAPDFALGPLRIDPVRFALGRPLREILTEALATLLDGPVQEAGLGADRRTRFPLRIAEGDAARLPLGRLGYIALANRKGMLALALPWAMRDSLEAFGDQLVAGPDEIPNPEGEGRMVGAVVRTAPGMRRAISAGIVGELAIEVR